MISTVSVRAMRAADIPALVGVLGRAYGSEQNFEYRLHAYLEMRGVATFVADLDGVPVGMVVGNDYGPVAYVSQMAVDPAVQRRGIGTRLMDGLIAWVDARRFAATELDATPAGAPLYARYGFTETGRTDVYAGAGPGGDRCVAGPASARPYADADRAALFAADARAFGADRREVLGLLIDAAPQAVVVVDGDARCLAGYAVAQARAQLLGPVIARDPHVAALLIDAAGRLLPAAYRVSVPSATGLATARVEARGFRLTRSLRHMVRGTLPPAVRERIYARINLGQG